VSYEVAGVERRTEVLRRALDLSGKLAEFITQHYCPKTVESDIPDAFYLLLASVMDVIVEGLGVAQALERHRVLGIVKSMIAGEPGEPGFDEMAYRMYVPTLGDVVAVLNYHYYSFVSTCLSEEYKLKLKAEAEKAGVELERKTKKKKE